MRSFALCSVVATTVALALAPGADARVRPGSLDTSFGSRGIVFPGMNAGALEPAAAQGLIRRSDGRFIAAGWSESPGTSPDGPQRRRIALAGLTSRGRLDATFGTGGKVFADLPSADEGALAAKRLSDTRIVVAGWAGDRMMVARFMVSGSLDPAFGDGGVASAELPTGRLHALVMRAGGRILAAGESQGHMAVVRLQADGRLDRTFGSNGVSIFDRGPGEDRVRALGVDARGRIVVAGGSGPWAVTARLLSNGRLDRGFGVRGFTPGIRGEARAVAIGPGSGPIVGGVLGNASQPPLLARYDDRGRLLRSFGHSGVVHFSAPPSGLAVNALTRDSRGRILIAGGTAGTFVARTSIGGTPDSGFGRRGVSFHDLFEVDLDTAYALVVEPSAKIVTAGTAATGGDEGLDTDFSVLRFVG